MGHEIIGYWCANYDQANGLKPLPIEDRGDHVFTADARFTWQLVDSLRKNGRFGETAEDARQAAITLRINEGIGCPGCGRLLDHRGRCGNNRRRTNAADAS